MLGLEILRLNQAVNLGWLLLVLAWDSWRHAAACLIDVKNEPVPDIHMEKQLGWACKLGEVGPLWISKLCHTVLPGSWSLRYGGEDSEKGQWPLLALMPDTSVSPCVPLVPFMLPPSC